MSGIAGLHGQAPGSNFKVQICLQTLLLVHYVSEQFGLIAFTFFMEVYLSVAIK
jgi:hypothetical protein